MRFGDLAVLMRIDDDKARFVVIEMPFDQGQGAFADRAEADHDNGAGNFRMDLRGGRAHEICLREMGMGEGDQAVRRFAVISISTFISGL